MIFCTPVCIPLNMGSSFCIYGHLQALGSFSSEMSCVETELHTRHKPSGLQYCTTKCFKFRFDKIQ